MTDSTTTSDRRHAVAPHLLRIVGFLVCVEIASGIPARSSPPCPRQPRPPHHPSEPASRPA